jgi:hypothetical protein
MNFDLNLFLLERHAELKIDGNCFCGGSNGIKERLEDRRKNGSFVSRREIYISVTLHFHLAKAPISCRRHVEMTFFWSGEKSFRKLFSFSVYPSKRIPFINLILTKLIIYIYIKNIQN